MSEEKQTLYHKISVSKETEAHHPQKKPKSPVWVKLLIFGITIIVISLFFIIHINEDSGSSFVFAAKSGDIWSKPTITAQYTFPVYKRPEEYLKEMNIAVDNTPSVFVYIKNAEVKANEYIDNAFKKILTADNDIEQVLNEFFSSTVAKKIADLKKEDISKLFKTINKQLSKFYSNIYKQGLLDTNLSFIKNDVVNIEIPPNLEKIQPKELLIDYNLYLEKAKDFNSKLTQLEEEVAFELVQKNYKPSLLYSPKLSDDAKVASVKSVAKTNGFVHHGEVIISKGETVTNETTEKIQSYHYYKYLGSENKYTISMIIGNIGHATIIYLILMTYIFILRKKIWADITQLTVLSCVLILVGFLSWLSLEIKSTLPIEYFIFLPGLSMLIAITFDSRTAFYVTVTMALLLTGIRGNDYDTGTAMMFSGILASYSVRDIQSRTQMFKSILFIYVGFVLTIISFSLERNSDIEQTTARLLITLINAVVSPLLTFGLLILIEKYSNITTDLRLEEYNNLNHPLLIKMSEIAPGTYQHTLSMAMLAEKCSHAIGANHLLAKVGAYYHDIGKMIKPEYFVENQLEFGNKHDLISPKRSADAIKTHVVEGIKLAREYELPQRIIDFIPMHHGTFLIKHFYAKALDDADGAPVNESDYRYPGPKPNTKETAIVMICDSAEAISRLPLKNKEDLERAIENTIQTRFIDGQFDECSLTLHDLHVIKMTCLRNLIGISHARIEYKEIPEEQHNEDLDNLEER